MKLLNDFIAEMDRGLSGEESSMKMIPSYVTQLAAGNEAGHVRHCWLDTGD
jgi:hexokinase